MMVPADRRSPKPLSKLRANLFVQVRYAAVPLPLLMLLPMIVMCSAMFTLKPGQTASNHVTKSGSGRAGSVFPLPDQTFCILPWVNNMESETSGCGNELC